MNPNIVVLLLDATRMDHLSCYGYDRKTTPFFEQLAEDSVVYDRAYSQSIWTLPSYASIFTGKYPSDHRAVDWNSSVQDRTFVDNLNESGYRTHTVSAHLGAADGMGIVDSFETSEPITIRTRDFLFPDDPVFEEIEKRRKANTYDSAARRYLAAARLAFKKRSFKSFPNALYHQYQLFRRRHGLWTDNGADRILSRAEEFVSEAESPYFLFLDFLEAHQPYRPPREYIGEFLPDDVSVAEMNDVIDANHIGMTIQGEAFTDRERMILEGLYDAAIHYLDDRIESFYRYLEETGEAENTVFVVLADHGDLFGEWGLWGHQGRIQNRLCHVPLLIRYPWGDGRREDGVTELRQLFDHFSAIGSGVNPNEAPTLTPQGEALIEYFGLDTQISITPWEEYEDATRTEWGTYQASLVRDRWRLFCDATRTEALYDVLADPDEHNNLAANHPDTVVDLHDRIEALVGSPEENHQAYRSTSDTDSFVLDEDTADHLEELGYL